MAKFVKSLHCHFSVVFINHVKYYTLYNAFSLYLKLCSCDWEGELWKRNLILNVVLWVVQLLDQFDPMTWMLLMMMLPWLVLCCHGNLYVHPLTVTWQWTHPDPQRWEGVSGCFLRTDVLHLETLIFSPSLFNKINRLVLHVTVFFN